MSDHFTHEGEHHDADGDAICPVCRSRVNSATAPSRTFEGRRWFFCNEACLRAWDRRPAHYAARARAEGLTGDGQASPEEAVA
jgi:YHS domain-containing protein